MAKSSGTTTTTQQPVGVNRRTLLRTGAHAAWAIPAVQIVTQSPALAATGPAALSVTGTGRWTGPKNAEGLDVNLTVENANTLPTTALQVVLTFPTGWSPSTTQPAGWSGSGSGNVITYTKTGAQLGGNSSVPLVATLTPSSPSNRSKAVDVSVSAIPGGNGAAGATTLNVPKG